MSEAQWWFDVSKVGLQKLAEGRRKSFALYELFQNGFDEHVTRVDATLERVEGSRGKVRLTVTDDSPQGFADLKHAYTLYAESTKKANPEQRGLYDRGEKLVLALCDEARITTTTGSVIFAKDGTRRRSRQATERGSRFEGVLSMTLEELADVERDVLLILPPSGITATFNGKDIPHRPVLASTRTKLPTIVADSNGIPRKVVRETALDVVAVLPGEQAMIYEMGIPIVETGDRYHVNIQQKVPQNADRDNVSPAYLRQIRTEVLNLMHTSIADEDAATEAWVTNALEDERVAPEAVATVLRARFGEKAVAYDPSDAEANYNAVASGYKLIHGGVFNRAQWERVRDSGSVLPAGKVFPTPHAYGDGPGIAKVLSAEEYTGGMQDVVSLTHYLARKLLGRDLDVRIVDTPNRFAGAHVDGGIDFNLYHLKAKWFDLQTNLAGVIELALHELAHFRATNHLDKAFYKAIQQFSGRVAVLALQDPAAFTATGEASNRPKKMT